MPIGQRRGKKYAPEIQLIIHTFRTTVLNRHTVILMSILPDTEQNENFFYSDHSGVLLLQVSINQHIHKYNYTNFNMQ